jgi:hypothetical protein
LLNSNYSYKLFFYYFFGKIAIMSLEVIAIEPIDVSIPPKAEELAALRRRADLALRRGVEPFRITQDSGTVKIPTSGIQGKYEGIAGNNGGTVFKTTSSLFEKVISRLPGNNRRMPGNVTITNLNQGDIMPIGHEVYKVVSDIIPPLGHLPFIARKTMRATQVVRAI